MKDNLESYFRKHLHEESGVKDDWSLPSDDVWGNAVTQFPDEQTDKKLIYLWWIVGALVLTLSLALFYISHLNGKVEQYALIAQKKGPAYVLSEDIKDEKKLKKPQVNAADLGANNHKADDSATLIESMLNKAPKINRPSSKDIGNAIVEKQVSPEIDGRLQGEIIKKVPNIVEVKTTTNLFVEEDVEDRNIKSTISIKDDKSILNINTDLAFLSKKTIESITVLTLGVNSKVPIFNEALIGKKDEQIIIKKKPNLKHELNIFAGPSWTATPMDVKGQDDNLQGYNKLQTAVSFGLNYRLKLTSNWYLITGLGYQSIKSWSLSNQEMVYMAVNEYVDDQGLVVNDLSIPLPTPTGEGVTSIRMGQSIDNPILDGEHYNAILDVHQVYRYIYIPLGMGYRHEIGHKHSIQFEGGINYMKLLSQNNVMDASLIKSSDDSAMLQMKMDMSVHPKLKAPMFSVSTSLGYQYNLYNNLSLDFTIGYFKTLNPLYSTSVVQTKAHGISVSTGFTIKF